MVLTRRAYKARMLITRWLPNEVLTEIMRHTGCGDQATLCRVSKFFHALVLPILNRSIDLSTERPSTINEFCLGVIKYPERAVATRSISIVNEGASILPLNLLIQVLQLMERVQELFLNEDSPILHTSPRYNHMAIPQWLLYGILERHPTITHLCMLDLDREFDWTGIHLPNLRQYLGADKPEFLGSLRLLPPHRLEEAKIMWASWDIEPTLKALGSLSDPRLPFVFSNDLILWDVNHLAQTLTSLSVHMNYITSFQIRSWGVQAMGVDTIQSLTLHLPSFTKLAYLALNYVRGDNVANPVQDEQALQTWAGICPTLKACCLGETAWRKVGESGETRWEKYSKEDFEGDAGFDVFEDSDGV